VNVLFFPSIWPETFSYVVGEMMALGLPIVAFDLGAPGERLRDYPHARLCARTDGSAALDALIALHREYSHLKASA
jgi:glycosyltransferase involved in cell wall biosynthesis